MVSILWPYHDALEAKDWNQLDLFNTVWGHERILRRAIHPNQDVDELRNISATFLLKLLFTAWSFVGMMKVQHAWLTIFHPIPMHRWRIPPSYAITGAACITELNLQANQKDAFNMFSCTETQTHSAICNNQSLLEFQQISIPMKKFIWRYR